MIGQGADAAFQASMVVCSACMSTGCTCQGGPHPFTSTRAVSGIAAAPTSLRAMSDSALESRRNDLHIELARLNDELQRRGRTRNARHQAERAEWSQSAVAREQVALEQRRDAVRPLDSSDAYPFA